MSISTKPSPVEELKMIMYPEGLEMTNIISIMNEDLSFKIEDFHKLKEIGKLFATLESLTQALQAIDFIKIVEVKGQYVFSDSLFCFSLLNVPSKLTKEEILKSLNIEEGNYVRFYKKYLYWQLVTENKSFCEEFEKLLQSFKFTEDSKLRYEFSSKPVKELLVKKIQQSLYSRESSELKVSPDKGVNNYNSNDSSSNAWRKRSNEFTASKDNNSGSKNKFDNTRGGSFYEVPTKRERFNSEGDGSYQQHGQYGQYQQYKTNLAANSYSSIFGNPLRLDYSKLNVKYATDLSHKYTNKDFTDLFERICKEESKRPEFSFFIDEVCNEKRRTALRITARQRMYSEDYKKDRSHTFNDSYGGYHNSYSREVYNKFDKFSDITPNSLAYHQQGNNTISATTSTSKVAAKVPKNNPLQDMKYNPASLFK